MLKVNNLGKKFGQRWIFKNLSFHLKKGDFLAVTGPNGSGKSTLLKILAGLMEPTMGSFSKTTNCSIQLKLGYASTDLALYPSLSAPEHLEMHKKLQNIDTSFEPLLYKVGLAHQKHQRVESFSTGMKNRLKIALSIQKEPELLLLDEPTATLDEGGIKLVYEIMQDQLQRGILIVATNNLSDAKLATHRLAFHA